MSLPSLDTRPLDGLRALLNLWILAFHAIFMLMYFLTQEESERLFSNLWISQHGYLAVDGFFALTGYLLGLQLLRASASNSPFSLRKYYFGRFMRIMPAYIIVGMLHCAVISRDGWYRLGLVRLLPARTVFDMFFPGAEFNDNGCSTTPLNVFHLNMFAPFNGCFVHAWSVAVQYHAYLWLPLCWRVFALHRGKNLAWFVAVIEIITAVIRLVGQWHHSMFTAGTILGGALELFWYSNSLLRMHTIVLGMGLAYLSQRTAWPDWIRSLPSTRHALLHASMWALPVLFMTVTVCWKDWFGDYRYTRSLAHSVFIVAFAVGTPLCGGIFCWMIFSAVHKLGPFAATANTAELEAPLEMAAATEPPAHHASSSATTESNVTHVDHVKAHNLRSRKSAQPLVGQKLSDTEVAPASAQVTEDRIAPPLHTKSKAETVHHAGMGLSHALSNNVLRILADLSYMAYLIHPLVYNQLFGSPWLLYPPSAADAAPWSYVTGAAKVEQSNATFVPSGVAAGVLQAWFQMREVLFPHGTALTTSGALLYSLVAIVATYAASAVVAYGMERPLVSFLKRVGGALLPSCVWWYSVAVMVVGPLVHVCATVAVLLLVRPELEASLLLNYAPGDTGTQDAGLPHTDAVLPAA